MSESKDTMNTVRALMIEQLRALKGASPEQLKTELQRAKGMAEVTQTLVNSAKVEVDFLVATKQESAGLPFLGIEGESPMPSTTTRPGPGNGITSITQHRMGG
jgi:hypothetical protein